MRSPRPKNPRTPPDPLSLTEADVTTYSSVLWRIHTVRGKHPAAWNELRRYGPLAAFRWEPHPPPPQLHRYAEVSYVGTDYVTAFAEVFHRQRAIGLTPDRALSGWMPTRALELLDLMGSDWALHHGASASLPQAPKNTCRAWAQAIWEQLGEQVDGLLVPSTVLGDSMVVLLPRSSTAFPSAPEFSRNLSHSDVFTLAVRARTRLGWPFL